MLTSPFVEAFQKLVNLLDSKPKLKSKVERELPKTKNDVESVALVAPLLRMIDLSPVSTAPEKSETKSNSLREVGNKYYRKQDFCSALNSYNASISVAPVGSKSLALAFANRSVTLKAVGDLKGSIKDCNRALECGYPEELQYKIYLRLGQYYQLLGQKEEAKNNLIRSKELCSKFGLVEPVSLDLQNQLERDIAALEISRETDKLGSREENKPCEETLNDTKDFSHVNLAVRSKPSREMPASSECVRLSHNEKFGRHLIANTDINPGDVLIIEKPYMAVLFPEMKFSHCSHCFKKFAALLPCPTCCQVMYCNAACQDAAWKMYHEFECPILTSVMNFNPGAVTLLTVRVCALMGITKLSDFLDNPPPERNQISNKRTFDFNSKGQLDSSEFLHIYYLETAAVNRPYLEKLGRALAANYLLQILKIDTLPNFDKLGAFLMKISQSLSLHCFEFHEINSNNSGVFNKVKIAAAVYATINMLNHSCDPDVMQFYQGSTGIVVATKPIAKGSQIFSYYRTNFLKEPSFPRQFYLEKNYFFNCSCVACLKSWPTRYQLKSLLPLKIGSPNELSEACQIYKANEKNLKCIQLISKDHLPILVNLLKVFDKHGKRLTEEYCVCQDAMKLCFFKQGNYNLQ